MKFSLSLICDPGLIKRFFVCGNLFFMSQAAFCESLDQQNTTDNRNKSHIKKENCFNSKLYILYIRQKHALNEVTKVSKFTSESCSKRKTRKKSFQLSVLSVWNN